MKVIDLLNKIANGEETPKKIKYNNIIYKYNEQYDYKNELQINYYSVNKGEDFFNEVYCYSLNDKVEIIEEDKKIDEIERLNNIIKEAREYIESYMPNYDFDKTNLIKLLEILNKGE